MGNQSTDHHLRRLCLYRITHGLPVLPRRLNHHDYRMTLIEKKIEAIERVLIEDADWIAGNLSRDINLELAAIRELLYIEREKVQETFKTKMLVDEKGMPYWCPPSCKEANIAGWGNGSPEDS